MCIAPAHQRGRASAAAEDGLLVDIFKRVSDRRSFRRHRNRQASLPLVLGYSGFEACRPMEATMNGIIYLIGLIVVIMFILSFLGLR